MPRLPAGGAERLIMAPYSNTVGAADGSIMPVIITAHIAQSSSRCGRSHVGVIIQALAPVIGPYMSRAMMTIHAHAANGRRISSATTDSRSDSIAASRIVG